MRERVKQTQKPSEYEGVREKVRKGQKKDKIIYAVYIKHHKDIHKGL